MTDVKVHNGNNRQFDLLAYNIAERQQFHVEIGVTHSQRFQLSVEKLCESFDRKFFGVPPKREIARSDHRRRKRYFSAVKRAYREVGLSPSKIQRLWVCWQLPDDKDFECNLGYYCAQYDLGDRAIKLLTFRDEIIPQLLKTVRTAHYNDDALRTLSLLRQFTKQTGAIREKKRQRDIPTD